MPSQITVSVNEKPVIVNADASAAVAIVMAGVACRISVDGERRGPLCGMGICFECRATINGIPHCRSCQIQCEPGMDVRTDV